MKFKDSFEKIRKRNEFIWILAFILIIWKAIPWLFRFIDPQSGEFSIDTLYVPLIAIVYFFIALLIIWGYLALVFPRGHMLIDEIFEKKELIHDEITKWQRIKVYSFFFFCLVVLYGFSVWAVAGISAIMS